MKMILQMAVKVVKTVEAAVKEVMILIK